MYSTVYASFNEDAMFSLTNCISKQNTDLKHLLVYKLEMTSFDKATTVYFCSIDIYSGLPLVQENLVKLGETKKMIRENLSSNQKLH